MALDPMEMRSSLGRNLTYGMLDHIGKQIVTGARTPDHRPIGRSEESDLRERSDHIVCQTAEDHTRDLGRHLLPDRAHCLLIAFQGQPVAPHEQFKIGRTVIILLRRL